MIYRFSLIFFSVRLMNRLIISSNSFLKLSLSRYEQKVFALSNDCKISMTAYDFYPLDLTMIIRHLLPPPHNFTARS